MRITIVVLIAVLCTALGVWANSAVKVTGDNGAMPSPSPYNQGPKYKTVKLGCSTGVMFTRVTNNTGKPIPANAKITVQGVQADCSQTANGPLAKGKYIQLLGCQEKVTTCTASARWEIEEP